jgi:hypothetical protein
MSLNGFILEYISFFLLILIKSLQGILCPGTRLGATADVLGLSRSTRDMPACVWDIHTLKKGTFALPYTFCFLFGFVVSILLLPAECFLVFNLPSPHVLSDVNEKGCVTERKNYADIATFSPLSPALPCFFQSFTFHFRFLTCLNFLLAAFVHAAASRFPS